MTTVPVLVRDAKKFPELLRSLKGVDRVELKLTFPDSTRRSALQALEIDPLDARIRQVLFFDTPDLALNAAGVVVRVRRIKSGDDSVVKLRPVVPDELPRRLRQSPDVKVEIDVLPGTFVCAASLKARLGPDVVKDTIHRSRPLHRLFTKPQQAFFAANVPEGIRLDDLAVLGPITVLKLKFTSDDFSRQLVVEAWLYPDGSNIVELSTKCLPSEAFQVAAEVRAFLGARGIDLSGEQQTKTTKALAFFAAELTPAS